MALHPNIISPNFSNRAIYRLVGLPQYGDLTLNGKKASIGLMFSQNDILSENLKYTNTSAPANVTALTDSFKFVAPVAGGSILTKDIVYSQCIDFSWLGDNSGVFTYPIVVIINPVPKAIINKKITMFEDETYCLSTDDFFFSSDYGTTKNPKPNNEVNVIEYTIAQTPPVGGVAEFYFAGEPAAQGNKFGNQSTSLLCVKGTKKEGGNVALTISACNELMKCTTGILNVEVLARPHVEVLKASMTLEECTGPQVMREHLSARSIGTMDYDEIVFKIDWAATAAENNIVVELQQGGQRVETFLGSALSDLTNISTLIVAKHLCPNAAFQKSQVIVMSATNKYGKKKDFKFAINITQKPAVVTPLPPKQIIAPQTGCSYQMNFNGNWEAVGPCGLRAEIINRDVELFMIDKPVGQVVFVKDAEVPYSVLKTPEGLVKIPVIGPPTGDPVTPALPAPNGQATPGDIYNAPDGTKFVADQEGQWRPVEGTFTGKPNLDEVIKSGEYLLEVASLGGLPENVKEVMLNGNLVVKNPDGTWVPKDPTVVNLSFNMPFFGWIGPNEFYVRSGQAFNIILYSMRRRVRFDLMDGDLLYNNYHRNRTYKVWGNTAGPGGIKPLATSQLVYSSFLYEYHNPTNPYRSQNFNFVNYDKFQTYGLVYSKMPDGRLISFGATEAPFQIPLKQHLTNVVSPQLRDIITVPEYVMVYSNKNSTYAFNPPPNTEKTISAAYGGFQYGEIDVNEHFNAWKSMVFIKQESVYDPVKKKYVLKNVNPQAFALGEIQILTGKNFAKATDLIQQSGGEFNPNPPTSGTYSFNIRATDLLTGEQKYRTFRVHYGSGKSPNGNATETTDSEMSSLPSMLMPPKPNTAVCKFVNGVTSGCYFTK